MKILVVGDGHSKIHEVAIVDALKTLGHHVEAFFWNTYFISQVTIVSHFTKFQNKYLLGPRITELNHDLLKRVSQIKPDAVFIYRGTHIRASTIKRIKVVSPRSILIGYNNDDPFSPMYSTWMWRHFMECIPEYDIVFAYREKNLGDLKKVGAKRVGLLRSYYIPELNRPINLSERVRKSYDSDVVFVGHYEADQRVKYLESVVKSGWELRLFGPGYDWDPVIRESKYLSAQVPVRLVWGDDYNYALCGSKIALCFLSKLNRDTYTRRCFEIPATRTMMLAEYTDDLASLFSEGEDVEFFRDLNEMLQKIEFYLSNDLRREAVAEAGYQRVRKDGHDVVNRMKSVLHFIQEVGRS